MKELKILALLVIITGIIYWGVEPLAHSVMNPHVAPADYTFKDSVAPAPVYDNIRKPIADAALEKARNDVLAGKDINTLPAEEAEKLDAQIQAEFDSKYKAQVDTEAQQIYEKQLADWNKLVEDTFPVLSETINKGNAANGQELVTGNCVACHSIESQGFAQAMDNATLSSTYGVVPPDLSSTGYLYDSYYLFNFIKDPAVAAKVSHKFAEGSGKVHPMLAYKDVNSDAEIADMVAYLKNIAPKEMDNKQAFIDACARCHSVKYDGIEALSTADNVNAYMGVRYIPDLSIIIRARSLDYLHTFINDPQKRLPGTSMPRVGLNEQAEKQVIAYLESVGDSKKAERESLGIYLMGFFAIMAILAYLWKNSRWRDLH
ncbi:hypothetical protein CCZ01_01035 [Helicobacter monodelphidis]|uniref:c-type cytochrome n=1 Tax=Helicobacter sp. 15-1451 TaxID=2004995 RepID=UPI000DCC5C7F|nr:c-type cytochrome [Helicobacter sp. 15-1451]RAX58811.1 hypothetical protein CCZ01_01035 [Helicobacter sp. 15-1451]